MAILAVREAIIYCVTWGGLITFSEPVIPWVKSRENKYLVFLRAFERIKTRVQNTTENSLLTYFRDYTNMRY